MARIRTIKPSFFTSQTITSLPIATRLTFIGLWTHVDDEGRAVDDPRLIKAAVWPLDDKQTARKVTEDLDELEERGLIARYAVEDRCYLHIPSWLEHQKINRPQESSLPVPPPLTEDSLSDHGAIPDRSRQEGKGKEEEGKGAGRGRSSRTAAPSTFEVTEGMRSWATAKGLQLDLEAETERFLDHHRAKGSVFSDWTSAWRTWMSRAEDYKPRHLKPVAGEKQVGGVIYR